MLTEFIPHCDVLVTMKCSADPPPPHHQKQKEEALVAPLYGTAMLRGPHRVPPVVTAERTFDNVSYTRRLGHFFSGLDFNYESMEDELTCPVCLELYADPLMLPCSHSVCKKCLCDIIESKKFRASKVDGVECPSCRGEVAISKEKIGTLPRNLVLENIVIKYTEERSKSIRKSLSLDSSVADILMSPALDTSDFPEFPTSSRTKCELCETQTPEMAAWYCVQCAVAYCHSCFAKFHPRRGALARHKIRPPSDFETKKPLYCSDHETEQSTIFCDMCKSLVCHLCVCEGEGKHVGHKVLALDTACKRIKDSALQTKEESATMLSNLKEQRCKVETLSEQIQSIHRESCERIEQQYSRLVDDVVRALTLERDQVVRHMEMSKNRYVNATQSFLTDCDKYSKHLHQLSDACDSLAKDMTPDKMLHRAREVEPLYSQLKSYKKQSDSGTKKYDHIVKDKSIQIELSSGVELFRSSAVKTLKAMLDDDPEQVDPIIPHITSPTSPGKSGLTPRIQNKYLTTWGFSSTSFTAEELTRSCSWTITIEKNAGQWGQLQNGYLFGVGVASDLLNVKDLVGTTVNSYGIVCTGGSLLFSHDGKQECIVPLSGLPMCVTLCVNMDHPEYVILSYKLAPPQQATSLMGKRIIVDKALKKRAYPVFTVSQRVKLLFPTYV